MCNRLTKLSVTMWNFFRYIRWYVTMDSTQNAWSVTMWYTRRILILRYLILDGSLHLSWFPVFFGSKVFSTRNSNFRLFPSCFWFPVLFGPNALLKINILGGSPHFSWFFVLFGSKVFPAQNQYCGWFPSSFCGSQCCLASYQFIFVLWLPVL